MILIDTNLWLYACLRELPQHSKAHTWLNTVLNGEEPVALPWNVVLAVLRLSTSPAVLQQPLQPVIACDLVEGWLGHPLVHALDPGPRHWTILAGLIKDCGKAGNLVNDAHLAALAIEHGCLLCSCDADFGRFPGLRFQNPLG